ncbi:hypothetical protein [Sinomicrobium oceani]|uniref:hypothetical protein n=1 Tax=Sinomicrobium oceani TaxID=1150368 RepID=UPI00227C6D4A|nr:hypothetical protein [Sinomicrobium oceani]
MFNEISWGEYALAVTLILTAYYAAVGLWLYILKLKAPVSGVKPITGHDGEHTKETISPTSFEETPEKTFRQAEELMDMLKKVIAEVFYHKQGRKVLLENLSRTLQKHPEFIGTPFQQGIQDFIIRECDKHGPVGLRADEVSELWSAEA